MSKNLLSMFTGSAPMGHNKPPSDMEILQDRITENNREQLNAVEQLLTDAECMPERVVNDDQAGEFSDLIKEITGTMKKLEAARVAEKEPYLALTRAVDGFFKVPKDKLNTAKDNLMKPLDAFLREKQRLARIAQEEEARRLREQADREAREAAEMEKDNPKAAEAHMIQAQVTEQRAQHVAEGISTAPTKMAKSRGTSGALAGFRTRWVGEIADRNQLDLNALRPYLSNDDLQKALNAAVRSGARQIVGARIYEKNDTVVR